MDMRARLRYLGLPLEPTPREDTNYYRHASLEELVAGEWQATQDGRCFVAEQRFPLAYRHGHTRLEEVLGIPQEVWLLASGAADGIPLDMRSAAFVDTETTGLSCGGGTFAFLVGLGSCEGDEFVLRQYFMPDYSEEPALLALVSETLGAARGLVSFNGRSFDWPILETRYVLSGQTPPIDPEPHLDLLLLARRLWRRCLGSCALAALEAPLLGLERDKRDVPGYLIPHLYSEYVQYGNTEPMADVFYHNTMDILSLVALAARAGRTLGATQAAADPYRDPLALGILYERGGRVQEAADVLQQAARSRDRDTASDAARRLALLLRRTGQHEAAMAVWREQSDRGDVQASIELAKQYEHRLRDDAAALEVIDGAVARLEAEPSAFPHYQRIRLLHDLMHRRERVARRLERRAPHAEPEPQGEAEGRRPFTLGG